MGSEKIIRLLLVEDERKLARSIQRKLEHHGYRVKICLDGVSAEKQMKESSYDLIILDLTLPQKSGLDVLKDFRNSGKTTPVLILSARDTPKDRILGLDLGADDYMVKPFDSGELVARIESLLRRAGASNEYVLRAADLVMDVGKRTVERAGKKIRLSDKEFSLLEFFLRNKNQILTRKRLVQQVWGYPFETGTNIVDVYISYLRDAIDEEYQPKLIRTIHGEGFILMDQELIDNSRERSRSRRV